MVTVHQNSQKYVVMKLVFRKVASPVILAVNYLILFMDSDYSFLYTYNFL